MVDSLRERRLFSVSYDSVAQRNARFANSVANSARLAEVLLLSRLRLDLILSGRVVLTDAMLLDGALFAAVKPADLVREVSIMAENRGNVVIRMRAASLEECLLGLLRDQDGRVKSFEFSILPAGPRQRLSTFLSQESGTDGPISLAQLTQLFERAGLERSDFSRAVEHWQRWISHFETAAHCPEAAIWSEHFEFSSLKMSVASARHDNDSPGWKDGIDQAFLPAYDRIGEALRAGKSRTACYATADEYIQDPQENRLAKEYVDRVFTFAFSAQHGCEDLNVAANVHLKPVRRVSGVSPLRAGSLERLAGIGVTDIEMPSDFLARLALAAPSELAAWARREHQLLKIWRDEDDHGASLKAAIESLEEVLFTTVTSQRLEHDLLGAGPEMRSWTWSSRSNQRIKRYAPTTTDEAAGFVADSLGLGVLRTAVNMVYQPLRDLGNSRLGNPALITTDIGLPRRVQGKRRVRRESGSY